MCAQFAGMIFLIQSRNIFFEAGAERICCILFTCNFTVRNNIMDEELKDYYVPQIFRKVFCEHSKEQPRERRRKDRMKKIGFDNDKYLKMQSEHIRERISKFDNKLYLEFGGKLI